MTLVVPEAWKAKPDSRLPRVAELEIPAIEEGKETGELVVFFFSDTVQDDSTLGVRHRGHVCEVFVFVSI